MTTEASIARRTAKLAEQIGAGDGGTFLIVCGSGMRGIKEACAHAKALRDGTAPQPEPNGMASYRVAVLAEKAKIAERALAEPDEVEEPITPLPRPVVPATPAPRSATPPRPARPPSRAPAPAPAPKAAAKTSASYNWEDL